MEFLETITAASSPATKRTITSLWENWLEDVVRHNPTVSAEGLVEMWLGHLKPSTVKKLLTIYEQWYRFTYEAEINLRFLKKKVNRMCATPKVNAWKRGEAHSAIMLSKHFDPWLHDMMIVTLHTGMRKGEMFGLKWADIDFQGKRVNIRRSWDGPTKSGKPRSVPMSKKVEEVLNARYNQQQGDQHIFSKCDANAKLKNFIKKYTDIQLTRITWHGLRHTFATLALESGRSPKLVSEMLGHSKVSTTIDLYWNKTGEDLDLDFLPQGDYDR